MSQSPPETPGKHGVLLADSQPVFRDGLRSWLERQSDLWCCGEAGDGPATLAAAATLQPHLLALDLALKTEAPLDFLKSFTAQFPNVAVLVISQQDEMVYGDPALRHGARGYIMKDAPAEEILAAMRKVLSGEVYVSQRLAGTMIRKLWQGDTSRDVATRLSEREREVFQMLGSGHGTRLIAQKLGLSIKTVAVHREHIKEKLKLKDAARLIHAATRWVEEKSHRLK